MLRDMMDVFRASVADLKMPVVLVQEDRTLMVDTAFMEGISMRPQELEEVERCKLVLEELSRDAEESTDDIGQEGVIFHEGTIQDASVLGRDVWGMVFGWLTLRRLMAVRRTSRFFRDAADAVLVRRLNPSALGDAQVSLPEEVPEQVSHEPGQEGLLRHVLRLPESGVAQVMKPHALRVFFLLKSIESSVDRFDLVQCHTKIEQE